MHGLLFQGPHTIAYETLDDPQLVRPSDAIVRVNLAGLCGSDLHVYHGHETGIDQGTAMGHEFVGEVVEIGAEVRQFAVGDRVVSPFTCNCGDCAACSAALTSRCDHSQLFGWIENGNGLHGGQAEYVRVPHADATLLRLPESVSPEAGLLLGDNFATGYFCTELAEVGQGGTYLVLGCGAVGLLAVASAVHRGAERVYAYDPVGERLQTAESFGAIPITNTEQLLPMVLDATDGSGVDGVLEVVGNASAQRIAFDAVRLGGTIASIGVHTPTSTPNFAFTPAECFDKNVTYRAGRCPARHYMGKLLPILEQGKLPIEQVITQRLPLADGAEAYRNFSERQPGWTKAVFDCSR
jgi:2-desacetyl-2-hydroxyethyl bacteriochlorophyllide A dehydrogenase